MNKAMKASALLSLLLGLLCAGAVLVSGAQRPTQESPLAPYAAGDTRGLEAAYGETGAPEALLHLLKNLCAEAQAGRADEAALARYGGRLLALARAGEVDLQGLGDEAETLEVLAVLREHGVG